MTMDHASLMDLNAILSAIAQSALNEIEEPVRKKGKNKKPRLTRSELDHIRKYRAVILSLAEIVLAWSSLKAAEQCTWGERAMRLILEGKIHATMLGRRLPEISQSTAESMDAMSKVFMTLIEHIPAHDHEEEKRSVQ
jgi:hypothetical protein